MAGGGRGSGWRLGRGIGNGWAVSGGVRFGNKEGKGEENQVILGHTRDWDDLTFFLFGKQVD